MTALSVLLVAAFTPRSAQANPTYPYPWPDYSVVPVLFVPTDWSVSDPEVQNEAASINAAMAEIRTFYATNNGGRTFRLNGVQVVQANSAKEAYGITHDTGKNLYVDRVSLSPSFEHLVVTELAGRGYPVSPAQSQAGYSTLIFAKGAGGYAGGRAYPVQGGHAILGDWAIDSLEGDLAEWQYPWGSGKRLQTGATAHELGHSFTLPHPDGTTWPYTSTVMGNWWDYPTIGLNNNDRSLLAANRPLFFPSPPATPAAPTNQLAVAQSGTSIRVTWTDNSINETSFQIYNGVTTVSVGANVTSYTQTGLAQGTYMCFAIKAVNAAGSSAWTPYACTTTPTVPGAPSGQTATPLSTSQIRVNWTDNSANETGFQIYDGVGYFTVGANTTSFTRTGLASKAYMCFAIRSYNLAGYSAWTPYACTSSL